MKIEFKNTIKYMIEENIRNKVKIDIAAKSSTRTVGRINTIRQLSM
jgi:hypothetical protein